jgi:DNA-binding NarL/FixJ family response regulator
VIRILLVDDHPVVREGIAAVLSDEADFEVVGEVASGEQALAKLDTCDPDVVVLDYRLPGMNGTEACEAVLRRRPNTRVVILTGFPNEATMLGAFNAGARAFVVKESDSVVLRQAIRTVVSGNTYIDPRAAGRLVAMATKGRRAKGPFGLTVQELRVVALLPKGFSNREIGEHLGVSEQTVKTHLHHALRKLNARDRAEAAAIATKEGLA